MQASGVTMDDQVKTVLEDVTKNTLRQWLHDRCALRCWCSDEAAEQLQLQLSDKDKTCLENERKSLLNEIEAMESDSDGIKTLKCGSNGIKAMRSGIDNVKAMKSGSNNAVNNITAQMLELEVTSNLIELVLV
jgi:hypothetical protein